MTLYLFSGYPVGVVGCGAVVVVVVPFWKGVNYDPIYCCVVGGVAALRLSPF